jgi:hypothetical protein
MIIMGELVLNTISTTELREVIREELESILSNRLENGKVWDELLSRQDVAALFGITLTTVDAWSKKGILVRYEVERRIYFKRSEVEKTLLDRRA